MAEAPPPLPPAAPRVSGGPAQSSQADLRSINCTQCGAPITLHGGGHKVLSITCAYCGSELDAKAEYQVITQFNTRERPITPIELGMKGQFKGVEFTVIALVQYRTTDGYAWLEFALYSPTHGYAWLEQINNHFLFSRRTRDLPSTPMRPQVKSTFKVRDRTYRVFESYTASIIYVEGELTFVAEKGDKVRITEAISPPYIYSVERTASEEEYVVGEYLEPEVVYAALGLPNEPAKRHSVHPAQPYAPSPLVSGLSRAGLYFMSAAALILVLVLVLGLGNTILVARFDARVFKEGLQSQVFNVSDPGKLVSLDLYSRFNNAWAAYDIQVHKGDKPIFSMEKQISYYSGYEGGEYWSEGSQSAHAYFKVPEAGAYRLVIKAQGGTGRNRSPPRTGLVVKVREGIVVSRYFLILLVLFTLAFSVKHLARWRFESKRWEDTEDDD